MKGKGSEMSENIKMVEVDLEDWRRLRRLENAACWCIGYMGGSRGVRDKEVVRRLEEALRVGVEGDNYSESS